VEGIVAFFALLVVGVVVAQTWLDLRDTQKNSMIPDWAKGMALAGVLTVSLSAAASFASAWLEDAAGQWSNRFRTQFSWPELGFLLCAIGGIALTTRKRRLGLLLVLTGVTIAAFWVGMMLS
jgi:hypothetical protein